MMQSTSESTEPGSDQNLLRACRMGDAVASTRLLDKYERLVYSIARNTGLSAEEAADITQLTFTLLSGKRKEMR